MMLANSPTDAIISAFSVLQLQNIRKISWLKLGGGLYKSSLKNFYAFNTCRSKKKSFRVVFSDFGKQVVKHFRDWNISGFVCFCGFKAIAVSGIRLIDMYKIRI